MSRYIRLLRTYPDLARLWLAEVISLTGDWFSTVALSALVIKYSPEETHGLAISLFLLARGLPPMLLSPYAGVLVDRFNRRWLMIISDWLRAVVVLGLLLVVANPDLLWAVYALTMLQFVLSTVFAPAMSAMIPAVVEHEDLVIANTMMSATWSAMLAFGAALGGFVSASFGVSVALVFDVITYVLAGWLIWQVKSYKPAHHGAEKAKSGEKAKPKVNTGFFDGLRYLRAHPEVAAPLMVKAGNSVGNVDTLMTIMATQVFVLGADGQVSLGIMYSAFGFGAVLGPVLMNRYHDGSVMQLRRLIIWGFVAAALGWLVMGAAGSLIAVCLGLLIRAMGGSANWTYSTVVLQKCADDAYMGRVFSLDMMGFYFASVVSTIVHGALVDTVGAQNAQNVATGTFFMGLVPLVAWVLLVRMLERRRVVEAEAPV